MAEPEMQKMEKYKKISSINKQGYISVFGNMCMLVIKIKQQWGKKFSNVSMYHQQNQKKKNSGQEVIL